MRAGSQASARGPGSEESSSSLESLAARDPEGARNILGPVLERTLPLLAKPYVQQHAEEQKQQEEVRGVEAGKRRTPVG